MSEGISDRGLQLLKLASLKELAQNGSTAYVRWQNIKRAKVRIGADEIEILGRVLPRYRWWLITGEVMLEIEQISPEHDQKINLSLPGKFTDRDEIISIRRKYQVISIKAV